ncbi:MAG: NADPH-dependent F420 reductase [Proteobacteria bacterium]|nr:NADPH-dependent F420 reductase [Pseudomonadota bacterium]
MSDTKRTLAVIGGTGALGGGLARRWAKAGHNVIIGSRDGPRAQEAAVAMMADIDGGDIQGMENGEAAAAADIVALTVPFSNQQPMLEAIINGVQGKILIDATVPLMPPKVGRVQLPEEDSAAVKAQNFVGENVRVVAAFQNIGAEHLNSDHEIACDVLVSGDDIEAREIVVGLVEDAGLKGWHAGPLSNSAAAEALTSVLITINRRYKIAGAGIRITGTPGEVE